MSEQAEKQKQNQRNFRKHSHLGTRVEMGPALSNKNRLYLEMEQKCWKERQALEWKDLALSPGFADG